jgi:hypothetical protein
MKKIDFTNCPSKAELMCMYKTIMLYMRGECKNPLMGMSERTRQYFTWGAKNFKLICAENGLCYGIQFNVTGLLHKGRVRVYYNRASDYFDIELLKARKDEVVFECEDLDFTQLHNVLHQHIERTDDAEV